MATGAVGWAKARDAPCPPDRSPDERSDIRGSVMPKTPHCAPLHAGCLADEGGWQSWPMIGPRPREAKNGDGRLFWFCLLSFYWVGPFAYSIESSLVGLRHSPGLFVFKASVPLRATAHSRRWFAC